MCEFLADPQDVVAVFICLNVAASAITAESVVIEKFNLIILIDCRGDN